MKKEQKRISKRMKELRGKLRKKAKGGNYYYRLTITNGVRKEFALKTSDENEAIQKASDLDAVYEARATEIDAILLTRYSYLHNAHLSGLFQSEKVRRLWLPYPENEDEYYKMAPLKEMAEREGVEVCVYRSGEELVLFDSVYLNSYRTSINRSSVPISIVTVKHQTKRLTYYSPAFNEAELTEEIINTLESSEFLIFGNRGPITKTDYTIPTDNDAELIVFADETRAAYFRNDGIINTAYALVPDKIRIKLTK